MAFWDKLFGGGKPAFGSLGRTVAEARKSNFFTWFHLEPATDSGVAGAMRFRPSSDQFGPLVAVDLIVADDQIKAASLEIRRDFIDDPRQFPFAADIAKSFLLAGLGADQAVEAVANTIMAYRPAVATATVIRRADTWPETPPRAGFDDVYAGRSAEMSIVANGLTARMSNAGDVLRVDIRPN